MKKRIISLLAWLGIRENKTPADLPIKLTILKGNIKRCQSYDELLSCEKMFQWYVDKYAADGGIKEFKTEVIKHLQFQRMIIQTSTNQTFGHGNPI